MFIDIYDDIIASDANIIANILYLLNFCSNTNVPNTIAIIKDIIERNIFR